jgi:hypothetical protein
LKIDPYNLISINVRSQSRNRLSGHVDAIASKPKENKMQIGMVCLGKMGAYMTLRLMRGGYTCVVFDRNPIQVADLVEQAVLGSIDLEDYIWQLAPPCTARHQFGGHIESLRKAG